jgi:rsbT co-antagonist protein RsbR
MATKAELEKRVAELEAELTKANVFQQLAEASGQGLVMATLEGQVTYVNPTVCRIAEVDKPEDFYGNSLTLYYPEELQPRLQNEVLPAVMQKGQWIGELAICSTRGKITPTLENIFLIRDDGGNPFCLANMMTDLTERKQGEEKLKELEHIVNHSPAIFFLWRAAEGWPVEFVSDNVEQFGYTPEDFYTGRVPYTTIVHADDLEQVAAEVTRYSQEEGRTEFSQEYRIITRSGEVRWTNDRTWIRRDAKGNITHYQGIVLDVTEQKQTEVEREHLQQELIEAQKRAIQELSTPVIPIMERIIVMPLIGSIDSLRARDITRSLLAGINQHRAKVVILDVTGVGIMDTGIVNHLNKTIQAARLKGAKTIVTGISDAVAEAIVDLGIDWGEVETLSDLRTGLVTALGSLGLTLSQQQGVKNGNRHNPKTRKPAAGIRAPRFDG